MSSIIRKSLILEGLRSKWQHQHEISQSWYPCWEPKIPEPGMGADGSCCSFWIIVQCRIWQSKQKKCSFNQAKICYLLLLSHYCLLYSYLNSYHRSIRSSMQDITWKHDKFGHRFDPCCAVRYCSLWMKVAYYTPIVIRICATTLRSKVVPIKTRRWHLHVQAVQIVNSYTSRVSFVTMNDRHSLAV